MQYRQLDRIIELDPGRRLVAQRTLRPDEQYLKDHFPKFPVMPGVMMLEALHQAAMWMIRTGDNFASPLVLLRETRGVKFGDFLCPGETLDLTVEWVKDDGALVSVKAIAEKAGRTTVSARFVLEKCSTQLSERLGTDELVAASSRMQFESLFGPLDQIARPVPSG
jgi:3-hydroxyacyl-[acyl-carrier-protein] dehydratase